MPSPTSHHRIVARFSMPRETSAVSARMPPSPWLSARMISVMYFSVTTISNAQTNAERMPSTFSCETESPNCPVNAVRSAYSGLVPMSP
jgi:hypothetical protein